MQPETIQLVRMWSSWNEKGKALKMKFPWYLRCDARSGVFCFPCWSRRANSLRSSASFRLLPGRLVHVASLVCDTWSMFGPTGTSDHVNICQFLFIDYRHPTIKLTHIEIMMSVLWRSPTVFVWKTTPIWTLLWFLKWPPWPFITGGHPQWLHQLGK